jgi:hypothetical protein
MFSELSDLLKLKRQAIGSQLLTAIQLVRSWVRAGFKLPNEKAESELTDKDIARSYNVGNGTLYLSNLNVFVSLRHTIQSICKQSAINRP